MRSSSFLVVSTRSAAGQTPRPLALKAASPPTPSAPVQRKVTAPTSSSHTPPWQGDRKVTQEENPKRTRAAMAACGAALSLALSAASLWVAPGHAMAELPAGKKAVTGPELVEIIKEDFLKRKYLVTGNLTKEVYSDHCHFADQRDDFGDIGLERWAGAVNFLFVGDASKLALTGDVVLDETARTITFTGWRQVDVFRLPGLPHTPVFTGHTVLTLDPKENLVVEHIESWDQNPDEVSGKIKFFDSGFNPPGFD